MGKEEYLNKDSDQKQILIVKYYNEMVKDMLNYLFYYILFLFDLNLIYCLFRLCIKLFHYFVPFLNPLIDI